MQKAVHQALLKAELLTLSQTVRLEYGPLTKLALCPLSRVKTLRVSRAQTHASRGIEANGSASSVNTEPISTSDRSIQQVGKHDDTESWQRLSILRGTTLLSNSWQKA